MRTMSLKLFLVMHMLLYLAGLCARFKYLTATGTFPSFSQHIPQEVQVLIQTEASFSLLGPHWTFPFPVYLVISPGDTLSSPSLTSWRLIKSDSTYWQMSLGPFMHPHHCCSPLCRGWYHSSSSSVCFPPGSALPLGQRPVLTASHSVSFRSTPGTRCNLFLSGMFSPHQISTSLTALHSLKPSCHHVGVASEALHLADLLTCLFPLLLNSQCCHSFICRLSSPLSQETPESSGFASFCVCRSSQGLRKYPSVPQWVAQKLSNET